MTLTPRLLGLAAGLVAGLLLVLVGWRILLILAGFTVFGYLVGATLESRQGAIQWLRDLYQKLFHS
jgi:hypothetical protein